MRQAGCGEYYNRVRVYKPGLRKTSELAGEALSATSNTGVRYNRSVLLSTESWGGESSPIASMWRGNLSPEGLVPQTGGLPRCSELRLYPADAILLSRHYRCLRGAFSQGRLFSHLRLFRHERREAVCKWCRMKRWFEASAPAVISLGVIPALILKRRSSRKGLKGYREGYREGGNWAKPKMRVTFRTDFPGRAL